MSVYIEEFLYRGRPEGSAEPPAWHLVLGAVGADAFGNPTLALKTLTMAEASEEGFALPAVIDAINTAALAELEAKRAALVEVNAALALAEAERDALAAGAGG